MFLYGRTILGLPGKIGNANTKNQTLVWFFSFMLYSKPVAETVHRTVSTPRQYVGLPGKIGNANIKASYESRRFFALYLKPAGCEPGFTGDREGRTYARM